MEDLEVSGSYLQMNESLVLLTKNNQMKECAITNVTNTYHIVTFDVVFVNLVGVTFRVRLFKLFKKMILKLKFYI